MNNIRKRQSLFFDLISKEKEEICLDSFPEQKIVLNIRVKKRLNVLLQYHRSKIQQDHFHIGLFISHGDVRLINLN
jgi:hypothetical protein